MTEHTRSDKVRALALAAIMVLSVVGMSVAFAGSAVAEENADYIVDADGEAGSYTSIQSAIDDASDGDRIYIYNGTYDETVSVSKNVTLVGESAKSTLLESTGTTLVDISGSDTEVTIKKVKIRTKGSTTHLIKGSDIGSLTLSDVHLNSNEIASYGVLITANNLSIDGSTIENAGVGVHFGGGVENVEFSDTEVSNQTAIGGETGHAIHGTVTSSATFENLTVVNNADRGIDVAGDGEHDPILITDSEIKNNNRGINVFGGDEFNITNNVIVGNDQAGLQLDSWWEENQKDAPVIIPTNNQFRDQSTHVYDGSGGLDLTTISSDNTFDRNVKIESGSGALISGIYGSIQPAVDTASDGDTVQVTPSTYKENVSISTANLTLEGPNVGITGADKDRGTEAFIEGKVEINADNVTVNGVAISPKKTFTSDSSRAAAIFINANNTIVKNNVVSGVTGNASGGSESMSAHGIQVFKQSGDPISSIVIEGNLVEDIDVKGGSEWPEYGGSVGVKIQNKVENVEVRGNTIRDINSAGWTYGVVSTPSNQETTQPKSVLIRGNEIKAVGNGDKYAVSDDPNAAP